jgi:hypothetical protein
MKFASPVHALSALVLLLFLPLGASAGETVHATLNEWSIDIDNSEVAAGEVTFRVTNAGREYHELVILRTSSRHDRLPVERGLVTEESAGRLIGEIEEFPPGETRTATFTLEPGEYVLFCNIVEEEENGELESHYGEGMHIALRVR